MKIELTAILDSEVVQVSDAHPARILVDATQIETVLEHDVDLRKETHRKVTEICLKPSIVEHCCNDEVAQSHRMFHIKESFDAVKAALEEIEPIIKPSNGS